LTAGLFRVAVILSVVILVSFVVTFVALFFVFLVRLLPKENIGNYRPIQRV